MPGPVASPPVANTKQQQQQMVQAISEALKTALPSILEKQSGSSLSDMLQLGLGLGLGLGLQQQQQQQQQQRAAFEEPIVESVAFDESMESVDMELASSSPTASAAAALVPD